MRKKGRLFIISAPSGCGKTTIVKKLLRQVKNLTPSISITTRAKRAGEKKQKDYHYISRRSFKGKVKNRYFLEWEENFGEFYGTPKKFADDTIGCGKDVLLTIDVKGAGVVKKKVPSAVRIFLKPPSMKELSNRLKNRKTEQEAEVAKRLTVAKKELEAAKKYDYVVTNKKLDTAVKRIVSIIKKERKG